MTNRIDPPRRERRAAPREHRAAPRERRAARLARALALSVAALLAGCSVAPVHERPAAPIAADWPVAVDRAAEGAVPAAETGWRDFFDDARLQRLIELSLQNNRDLRLAVLNVEAARAQYGIERADRLPGVDAGAAASRQRVPDSLSPTGRSTIASQYQATLGVTAFELDLFGRVRNLSDAALAEYFASAESRKAAQISLVAQVADAYLNERAAIERVDLLRQTLAAREESLRLIRLRYAGGVATELDLRQATSLVEGTRGEIADAVRVRAQIAHALALLIGQPLPADLPDAPPLGGRDLLPDLPVGLPSDLVERRPDIAAAEQRLRAANARIGAARAAFFPRIALTGAFGTASAELSGLFGAGSGLWSFLPQITVPIFDGDRNRAGLDLAEVRRDAAIAEYEGTIQGAFREVADALAAQATIDERVRAHAAQVDAARRSVELSDLRYRRGLDSFLQLLDAQRTLFAAEQALLDSRLARTTNQVSLYKSLGGGWVERDGESM